MQEFSTVILGAGMGTRMKSAFPKVIHKICGKPICEYVIRAAKDGGATEVITIVGHKSEMVMEELGELCEYAFQKEQKGTGHALMQAKDKISKKYTVVVNGDAPLITGDSIKKCVEFHIESGNSATVITSVLNDATGYGRIVRDKDQKVVKIVEQKDANDEEKKITEVNSGMYVFNTPDLLDALGKITPNNNQGEYYLTDTVEILNNGGKSVGAFVFEDCDEIRGINDRTQLSEAEEIMQKRILKYHMKNGVTIHHPNTVIIEPDVIIGQDTEIYPNCVIKSGTKIGSFCKIGDTTTLEEAEICDYVNIDKSEIVKSKIGSYTNVGPFAYVRPNCTVGENVKVGDFVELKNSTIDDGTKISHLTYIGDSDVGKKCNFGCGTVTVNYDGSKKYRTTIGDNVFVGCNSNLVAPVTLKDGAYTAAGSTITDEVPENTLAIARARQVNKDSWNDRRKK